MPCVCWLSSQAELLPSSCKGQGAGQALAVPWWDTGKQSKAIWCCWKEVGKEIIYIPDSWQVRQRGTGRVLLEVEGFLELALAAGLRESPEGGRAATSSQLAPNPQQRAWEGDPWFTASQFGRKAATDGVSQTMTAECCSKGWRAVRMMGWALSHFPFHITPGMRETVNETLVVNGARTRLQRVNNFSWEICRLVLLYHSTSIAFPFACCLFSPGCHCSCLILNNMQ